MGYKRLLAFGLMWLVMCASAGAAESLGDVRLVMQERAEGNCRVLIPTLTGHPDAGVQQGINRRIAERLRIEELIRTMERSKDWADESGASGVRMEGEAAIVGGLLSLVVSIQGELPDGTVGHLYAAYNCELLTGREVTLDDLFEQPEQGVARMEALALDALEREGINAYLERAEVAPLPRRDFAVDAQGVTVYYPADQYRLINGRSGAFRFPYYQIEDYLKRSPVTEALLAQRSAPDDPAERIRLDMANGELPGIPARLRTPMAEYIERYGLMDQPDYTPDGPLYHFEAPRMQGVRLSAAMYPPDPEDDSEAVINIRATLIDLYGLRPGVSALQDVVALLGPPGDVTALDAGAAYDMLLPEGESYWYRGEGARLEFHGDKDGLLTAVILHAGD